MRSKTGSEYFLALRLLLTSYLQPQSRITSNCRCKTSSAYFSALMLHFEPICEFSESFDVADYFLRKCATVRLFRSNAIHTSMYIHTHIICSYKYVSTYVYICIYIYMYYMYVSKIYKYM